MENISSSSSSSCDDDQNNIIIPQDVLIQILILLPVISLLRFKSVCKSWRALIQTSFFINLHLTATTTTTNKNNNFGTFLFQTSEFVGLGEINYDDDGEVCWEKKNEALMLSSSSSAAAAGGDDDDDDDDEFEKRLKLEDIGYPPRYKFFMGRSLDHILMVGSCNGLICLHDTKGKEVSLWNPATRQFRILPQSLAAAAAAAAGGIPLGDHEKDFVAFGYDVKTNDYKVLLISHFSPYSGDLSAVKDYIFRVQVYSLTTDSWRFLQGINYLPAFPRHHLCSNHGVYLKKTGSYYFLGAHFNIVSGEETVMLLSFDFTKEIFTTIQLPHDVYHHPNTILTSFGEKQLALFAEILVRENESHDYLATYDIWVLNEQHPPHGEEEEEEPSWTKLHSMRLNQGEYNRRSSPRSISNNGEFALISAEADRVINGVHVTRCSLLQLFNLVTQQVKKEFLASMVITAEVYKQSLVSIGGGNDTTADLG